MSPCIEIKNNKGENLIKRIILLLGILLLGSILFACAPKVVPVTPVEEKPAEVAVSVAREGWEVEWEKVLKEARKEGRVVIYGASTAAGIRNHAKLIEDRFGFKVEVMVGRGEEQINRMLTERRVGLFLPDVLLSGPATMYTHLKPSGALDPLEPVLIHPEVIDPKGWLDEKFRWGDKDRMVFLWAAGTTDYIVINTEKVRPDEIKSFKDLLNPKWKGKMVMDDPTTTGPGLRGFIDLLYNKIVEPDFFRQLAKQQEPSLLREHSLQGMWLAQGKKPIAIWPLATELNKYIEAGVPITGLALAEGDVVNAGGSALSLMNKTPHPNAATIFINWFLGKEGQTIIQKERQKQSRRIDISVEGMYRGLRVPGVKYFSSPADEEKFILDPEGQEKYVSLAKEIFGSLLK